MTLTNDVHVQFPLNKIYIFYQYPHLFLHRVLQFVYYAQFIIKDYIVYDINVTVSICELPTFVAAVEILILIEYDFKKK
jgi:hypothetical protein